MKMSNWVAKSILNSLIDGRPLTSIEDTPDVWEYSYTQDDGTTVYHCVRQSSLFKDVKPDGSVRYSDVDRFSNHELISDTYWHSGLITKIGEELHPINMHYIAYSNSFIIVTRECLYDEKNGDYDTIEVIQIHTPDGKKRDIQRYFREPNEGEEATYRGWVEIDEPEWLERWENRKR